MQIPKVEFDVYAKLSGKNLVKLSLSVCKDAKITISYPVVITDNLEKLNSSSDYYNDVCYIVSTDNGTDITTLDRQKEFVEGNNLYVKMTVILKPMMILIKKQNVLVSLKNLLLL